MILKALALITGLALIGLSGLIAWAIFGAYVR